MLNQNTVVAMLTPDNTNGTCFLSMLNQIDSHVDSRWQSVYMFIYPCGSKKTTFVKVAMVNQNKAVLVIYVKSRWQLL